MKTAILTITACCALVGTPAPADIYRYEDNNGTVCYTDTPQHRQAELIYRDRCRPAGESRGAVATRPVKSVLAGRRRTVPENNASPRPSLPDQLPVAGRITSLTGMRIDPIDGTLRLHNGVDIAVPPGTPVTPVAPGTVLFSGRRNGYGNMVVVDHGGAYTVYAHHDRNTVREGEPVTERSVIAYSGSTGHSTGPHLHFEAWEGNVNITDRFTGMPALPTAVARVSFSHAAPFRRVVHPDGSLLFTNLPFSHP